MSDEALKIAKWERTLLSFLHADTQLAVTIGPRSRFVVVISPRVFLVVRKAVELYGVLAGEFTIDGIAAVVDPDLTIEYVIEDMQQIAIKIKEQAKVK